LYYNEEKWEELWNEWLFNVQEGFSQDALTTTSLLEAAKIVTELRSEGNYARIYVVTSKQSRELNIIQ
jgi:hypothetical protein